MNYKHSLVSLLMLSMLSVAAPAFADSILNVGASRSTVISGSGVSRVAIADPAVADVIVSGEEIIIVGKKAGSTSLHVWNGDYRTSYTVVVSNGDGASAASIKEILGYPNVDVTVAGGKVILEGTVANQYEKLRAEKIAAAYGGEVINLLEMNLPKQIRIESRVVEISKSKSRNLGITLGNTDDTGSTGESVAMGTTNSFMFGQSLKNSINHHHGNNPLHWFGSYADINAQLNLLAAKGDAKILSQPYIITMSGDKSEVFIGGQLPIPVSNDNDVTVEWKDYGIKLNIEPVVQNNGFVDTKVETEVSSLDYANAVKIEGFSVPGLTSRKAQTHVMMKPGMTMAIGGLISSEQAKNVNKIPLLGDLPIIGSFFRSTSKSRQEREIIILLTPIVVDSDYEPVMSDEARRVSRLKDEEVLRGDLHVEPDKKKRK